VLIALIMYIYRIGKKLSTIIWLQRIFSGYVDCDIFDLYIIISYSIINL